MIKRIVFRQIDNKYVEKLEDTIKSKDAEIEFLKQQIALMKEKEILAKHKLFGSSSEKSEYTQVDFFNEAEKESNDTAIEPELEEIDVTPHKRKKKKGSKNDKLEGFDSTAIEYYLSEQEVKCPQCNNERHIIGKSERLELRIKPVEVEVVKHITYAYACRDCEKNDVQVPIQKSKAPKAVIEKSIASPSLIGHIMADKYLNGLPLYRQEQDFKRYGIDISRQNMANWVIKASNDWLSVIYDKLKDDLLRREVIHMDETTVQVLKEKNKTPQSNSYMWAARTSGDTDKHIIIFEYQPDRAHHRAIDFLKDFKGYLHSDGYEAYHKLSKDVIICGCMAHARRKFDEALKSIPKKLHIGSKALEGKNFCDSLFKIESKLSKELNLQGEGKLNKRIELATPILDTFFKWLKNCNALPKSALGKAVYYTLNQWEYLTNYLLDERCELSNNRGEGCIKPFVVARKNFLFCDTVKGANASAVTYSIIATAKENGLNPAKYLEYLFEKLPNIDFKNNPEVLDELLPWSNLPEKCYVQIKSK
ncbi:MAG: IS66 family transposase [Clostridium sp.]